MDSREKRFESVYSNKVRAGKRRTYFFDVRKTRGNDFYLTITESKKRFEGDGYERHKIFLYKEDFNRFIEGLETTINHIKEQLMPNYDYDEFSKRGRDEYYEEEDEIAVADESLDESPDNEPAPPPPPPPPQELPSPPADISEKKPKPTARFNFDSEDEGDLSW